MGALLECRVRGEISESLWARSERPQRWRRPRPSWRPPFEHGRTDLAERRMAASLVIEHLDIIEQRHLRLTEAGELVGSSLFVL